MCNGSVVVWKMADQSGSGEASCIGGRVVCWVMVCGWCRDWSGKSGIE